MLLAIAVVLGMPAAWMVHAAQHNATDHISAVLAGDVDHDHSADTANPVDHSHKPHTPTDPQNGCEICRELFFAKVASGGLLAAATTVIASAVEIVASPTPLPAGLRAVHEPACPRGPPYC